MGMGMGIGAAPGVAGKRGGRSRGPGGTGREGRAAAPICRRHGAAAEVPCSSAQATTSSRPWMPPRGALPPQQATAWAGAAAAAGDVAAVPLNAAAAAVAAAAAAAAIGVGAGFAPAPHHVSHVCPRGGDAPHAAPAAVPLLRACRPLAPAAQRVNHFATAAPRTEGGALAAMPSRTQKPPRLMLPALRRRTATP